MPGSNDVTIVLVGRDAVAEDDLVALSRAATVVGPATLVEAVRHLCPPKTELVVGDEAGDVRRPAVVLRPAATDADGAGGRR